MMVSKILGRKNVNGQPHIETVAPSAALPGGEVRILGSGLRPSELRRPLVRFGDLEGAVVVSADDFVIARVPQGASTGPIVVSTNGHSSNAQPLNVAGASRWASVTVDLKHLPRPATTTCSRHGALILNLYP